MFKIFRKKGKSESSSLNKRGAHTESGVLESPVWHQVGEGNPFDAPILDIRCVTLNHVSTTGDKTIAENFAQSRSDDGKQYINQEIPGCAVYMSSIRYPHNGAVLEGIVFKADRMEVKWDIYAYGEWFYFVRSWTSDLVYRVHYQNTGNELVLDSISTGLETDGVENLHEQNINSIMLTHVLGQVWPYTIPESVSAKNEADIALFLFSQFGCKATLATHADTLRLKLDQKLA